MPSQEDLGLQDTDLVGSGGGASALRPSKRELQETFEKYEVICKLEVFLLALFPFFYWQVLKTCPCALVSKATRFFLSSLL